MKKSFLITTIFGVLLLTACESHTDLNGKITYKNDDFSGTEEIGEFETRKNNVEVEIPYEINKLVGNNDARISVRYETNDNEGEFEESVEILSKKVKNNEKGKLSFTAEKSGEYEIYLHSKNSVETEVKINLKSLGGGMDLDE